MILTKLYFLQAFFMVYFDKKKKGQLETQIACAILDVQFDKLQTKIIVGAKVNYLNDTI